MGELTGVEYLGICLALGVCVFCALWLARFQTGKQRALSEEAQRVRKDALRKAVAAGTHDEQGFPLCRICGDKSKSETRATRYGFQIVRSEGFGAWLRSTIGAPARLRVGLRLYDDHQYCRECASVAEHALRAYLLAFEQQRRDQVRDAEVELRRFERAGLDERVKAMVDWHEREQKKIANKAPGQVIPFEAARR